MKKVLFLGMCLFSRLFHAQTTFPENGVPHRTDAIYAFVHAEIHADSKTLLHDAIMVVKNGKILEVGTAVKLPPEAIVIDVKGGHIYPSFIELCSNYGVSNERPVRPASTLPYESGIKGAYGWNEAVRPEVEAINLFQHDPAVADDYRKAGFGVILSSSRDGIVRGSSALVQLDGKRENESILSTQAAAWYSFNKGSSRQDYPSSLTGAIALLRQTFYDASWYAMAKDKSETNLSLEYLNKHKSLPQFFDAGDAGTILRAYQVAKEFSISLVVKGGGDEYQRVWDIKQTGQTCILPLNFPVTPDVEDPFDAELLTYAELKHWENAPANAAILERAKIPFCLTASDLKDRQQFIVNLRKALQYGYTEASALYALTELPAKLLKMDGQIGVLKKNYQADFFITSGNYFEDGILLQHWVNGVPFIYQDITVPDLRGFYTLTAGNANYKVLIGGTAFKPTVVLITDTAKRTGTIQLDRFNLGLNMASDSLNQLKLVFSLPFVNGKCSGRLQKINGEWLNASLAFTSPDTSKTPPFKRQFLKEGSTIYPFNAFGIAVTTNDDPYKALDIMRSPKPFTLFKNVTVWTNEKDSILLNTDVLIGNGKIVGVGKNLSYDPNNTVVVDGTGKHLTPGIIDEHSHIALTRGVNEGAQASSSEVRMGDVINPDDINIYRQLAGGVTCSQLLHGSANPIGGQSVLIKLRWGYGAEKMKYENAPGFIKFALGENVKQSNWGDHNVIRFPQSRMGVEQVFADHFLRARAYNELKGKTPANLFRRDLELEAIAEILAGKRFITCHSYVQSEINMLMKLADSLHFKVNTFTHILEGYKVADKMKQRGVFASTFSDWWAYKNEVMEAIPYNAAILTRVGVITAINSDDAEMGRRLNQEAAKCVKYGRLSEVQALKLVTLNPAIMLRIDDKVGSVRVGKSADLVLWNGHPLSAFSIVEKTMIDGIFFFDRGMDSRLQQIMQAEKSRILQAMLAAKKAGAPTQRPARKRPRLYHCDTMESSEGGSTIE